MEEECIISKRNVRIDKVMDKVAYKEYREYCNGYSSSLNSGRYSAFKRGIKKASFVMNHKVQTTNGAWCFDAMESALVELNARATELRGSSDEIIESAMEKAYAEDPIDMVKLLFQTGDVREGKGERRIFEAGMDWLVKTHPLVAKEVLFLIPEYTRWDHLVRLTVSDHEEIAKCATELVVAQFQEDLELLNQAASDQEIHISLLAKWMPSLQTKRKDHKVIVRHLLKALHMQERDYRKSLAALREHLNVIEKYMSANELEKIDMEKMTSKQQLRYAGFLGRNMEDRRHAYIQAVLRGEKKMNADTLNPVEVYHELNKALFNNKSVEDYEALWKMLPDVVNGNGKTLVIRDGSGSMCALVNHMNAYSMIDVSSSLAIYCAERMSGAFKDCFITFSSSPQFVDLSDCTSLQEKCQKLKCYRDYTNTDLYKTFDLILQVAVDNQLPQDELPQYLLIMSDMEFDGVMRDSGQNVTPLMKTIRNKWKKAGYEVPTLVYWQLNGRRTLFPEVDSESGIIYLSGFSTNELVNVMNGSYEQMCEEIVEETVYDQASGKMVSVMKSRTRRVILSPSEQLKVKLTNSRYDAVGGAALRGILNESETEAEK